MCGLFRSPAPAPCSAETPGRQGCRPNPRSIR